MPANPHRHVPVFLLLACGCAGPEVHPSFESLRPARIEVVSVRNATGRDLSEVSFAGIVGRVLGPPKFDVPAILHTSLEAELRRRGYMVVDGGEASEGVGAAEEEREPDAVLEPTILTWRQGTGAASFSMGYRLELRHVTSGELLYGGDFTAAERPESHDRGPGRIGEAIRLSVRRALAELPRGPAVPGGAVPPGR